MGDVKIQMSGVLNPDVRGAVPTRVADLMSKHRAIGLVTKVGEKVLVEGQASIDCVHIDLQHHAALSAHTGMWVVLMITMVMMVVTMAMMM